MLWFDFLLFLLPGLLLASWAQARIMRADSEAARMTAGSGLSGAEIAQLVMQAGGVTGVGIEPAAGELSNHYDTKNKVLWLSQDVYAGRSLAAMGAAAHEAGHAIQDASGYRGLIVRDLIVPLANLGSHVFWMLIAAGILLGMFRLIVLAIVLFSIAVLLQMLNLPVEFDASRRGHTVVTLAGLASAQEEQAVVRVLDSAVWTHVAATLTGALTPLSGLVGFGRPGR